MSGATVSMGLPRGQLTRKVGTRLRSTCWLTCGEASSKIPVHIIHTEVCRPLLPALSAYQLHCRSSRGCEKVGEACVSSAAPWRLYQRSGVLLREAA